MTVWILDPLGEQKTGLIALILEYILQMRRNYSMKFKSRSNHLSLGH